MADKKTTAKVAELEGFEELKSVKATAGSKKEKENKDTKVKIKVLVNIRSSYGAFNAGGVYEVPSSTASVLCADKRAEKC